MPMPPVLEVVKLSKHYPVGSSTFGGAARVVHALDNVSFTLGERETLSIVGESGCGKSTLARVIMGLTSPTQGEIRLNGRRIDRLSTRALRPLRRQFQVIFQDPFSSLNPRMRVADILAEPIVNFNPAYGKTEIQDRTAILLDQVRLPRDALKRYPHEFSGGQRQRIAIARALASNAQLLVCDEAVSALDVSVKAQIINLLQELQDTLGLSLLFISHDLAIVEHLTHRIGVMYLGQLVEIADRKAIFSQPAHPYTRALLSAVPVPDPERKRSRIVLEGDIPSPVDPPKGCRFHTRCPYVFDRCRHEAPHLRPRSAPGHGAACHLDQIPDGGSIISSEQSGVQATYDSACPGT